MNKPTKKKNYLPQNLKYSNITNAKNVSKIKQSQQNPLKNNLNSSAIHINQNSQQLIQQQCGSHGQSLYLNQNVCSQQNFTTLTNLQNKLKNFNFNFQFAQQQFLRQLNNNNTRLDRLINGVKQLFKTDRNQNKTPTQRKNNKTPDKGSYLLRQRVQKAINNNTKNNKTIGSIRQK